MVWGVPKLWVKGRKIMDLLDYDYDLDDDEDNISLSEFPTCDSRCPLLFNYKEGQYTMSRSHKQLSRSQ